MITSALEPCELLAQRFRRGGSYLYTVAMPLSRLHEYLPVPDPDERAVGNRRVSVAHARDFADYWATTPRWAVPPLLLDTPVPLGSMFEPLALSGALEAGRLFLPAPDTSKVQVLDGQHRLLGWSLLWERLGRESREATGRLNRARDHGDRDELRRALVDVEAAESQRARMRTEAVTLEILDGIELDDHKQYFFDIASNARGISKSLSAGFDQRDVFHRVAKALASEHPLLVDRVDLENDRVASRPGALLSLRNLVDLVTAAAVGVSGWIRREHRESLTQDAVLDVAEATLDALTGSFDDLVDVAEGVISPGDLRRETAPKHFLADPALTAVLLNVDADTLLSGRQVGPPMPRDGTLLGALFESLAALTLKVFAQAGHSEVSHLRTRAGEREVDFIVHGRGRRVVAVECKLTAAPDSRDLRHLLWLKERMGDALTDMVVLTTGQDAYRRRDGVAVIPLALLGP